jgi:hypothetical protein
MFEISLRTARKVSLGAALANLLASALMLFVLRRGLPPESLDTRSEFVSSHETLWRLGWLSWNVAAVTLIGLLLVLASRLKHEAPFLCALAIVVATAGLAADLSAEALLIGLSKQSPGTFESIQTEALLLTGFVANGLYTLAGILLTVAGRRLLPRALLVLAALVWTAGLWLAAATLVDSSTGEIASTGVLMPSFVIWAVLLGRWFGSLES